MKGKYYLGLLLLYVVGVSFLKSVDWLLALWLLSWLLSWRMMLKSIKATIFFNLSVTLGYLIASWWQGHEFLTYISMFNLRVMDISFAVFYLFGRINLLEAFSFSRSLTFLLVATISQIESFKKSYEDFILGFKSRTVKRLGEMQKRQFISSMLYFFLQKSLHNSKERTLALKARGFFD